jgi:hypothetical protein
MTDFIKNMPNESAALHKRARELVDKNYEETELIQELMKEDITENYARLILDNVLTDIRNKKDFYKMLVMGVFIIIGALLLNFMSYNYALRNGASFMLVFWGLIAAGIIILIQAIGIYRKLPRE